MHDVLVIHIYFVCVHTHTNTHAHICIQMKKHTYIYIHICTQRSISLRHITGQVIVLQLRVRLPHTTHAESIVRLCAEVVITLCGSSQSEEYVCVGAPMHSNWKIRGDDPCGSSITSSQKRREWAMQERVKVRSKDARNVLIQMLKPYRNGQMQGVYPSGCKHVVLIWGQAKDSGGTHEGNRRAYEQVHTNTYVNLINAQLCILHSSWGRTRNTQEYKRNVDKSVREIERERTKLQSQVISNTSESTPIQAHQHEKARDSKTMAQIFLSQSTIHSAANTDSTRIQEAHRPDGVAVVCVNVRM